MFEFLKFFLAFHILGSKCVDRQFTNHFLLIPPQPPHKPNT